jgi:hypothetical protein
MASDSSGCSGAARWPSGRGALIALTTAEHGAVRPRERDAATIEQGLEARDGSIFECALHLAAYRRACDRDEATAALASLDSAAPLAGAAPALLKAEYLAERAWAEAWLRGDAAAGRSALEAVPASARSWTAAACLRARGAIA